MVPVLAVFVMAHSEGATVEAQAAFESPMFLGHSAARNSWQLSSIDTRRWAYTFKGDWKQTVAAVKGMYGPIGYEKTSDFYKERGLLSLFPKGAGKKSKSLPETVGFQMDPFEVVSIVVVERSIRLIRDERLLDVPAKNPWRYSKAIDPGWITVIYSLPSRYFMNLDSRGKYRKAKPRNIPRA